MNSRSKPAVTATAWNSRMDTGYLTPSREKFYCVIPK